MESAKEAATSGGRGRSSAIRDTVLGGLATAMGAEDEEEEEEVDEEGEGVGLLPDSMEEVRNLGGSKACLCGGGSGCEPCVG